MLQDKLNQEKEAGKQRKNGEMQQESSRLDDLRQAINRAQQELGRDIRTLEKKREKKKRERQNT